MKLPEERESFVKLFINKTVEDVIITLNEHEVAELIKQLQKANVNKPYRIEDFL